MRHAYYGSHLITCRKAPMSTRNTSRQFSFCQMFTPGGFRPQSRCEMKFEKGKTARAKKQCSVTDATSAHQNKWSRLEGGTLRVVKHFFQFLRQRDENYPRLTRQKRLLTGAQCPKQALTKARSKRINNKANGLSYRFRGPVAGVDARNDAGVSSLLSLNRLATLSLISQSLHTK